MWQVLGVESERPLLPHHCPLGTGKVREGKIQADTEIDKETPRYSLFLDTLTPHQHAELLADITVTLLSPPGQDLQLQTMIPC